MKCLTCRGACCEEVIVVARPDDEFPAATREWFLTRGAVDAGRVLNEQLYAVENRCPKLDACGLCSVHDEKPLVCAVMPAGGADCLGAVRRRRTPEQYAEIRDENDPTPEEWQTILLAGPDGNPSFEACAEVK